YTFEVILYGDGRLLFQYRTLQGLTSTGTVGVRSPDGSSALQYLHNGPGLAEGRAVEVRPPSLPWPTAGGTPTPTGSPATAGPTGGGTAGLAPSGPGTGSPLPGTATPGAQGSPAATSTTSMAS